MGIIDRLKIFIESTELSFNEFDKSIGVGSGYIRKQIKNGASIGSHILEKIFDVYPELNVRWLMMGEGEMCLNGGSEVKKMFNEPFVKSDLSDLTLVNIEEGFIGSIIEVLHNSVASSKINSNIYTIEELPIDISSLEQSKYLCMRYRGEAMLSTFPSDTFLLMERVDKPNWFDLNKDDVYMVTTMEVFLIGRLIITTDEVIIVKRDNLDKDKHPDVYINFPDLLSIWRVAGYMISQLQYDSTLPDFLTPISAMEKQINRLQKDVHKLKNDILKNGF